MSKLLVGIDVPESYFNKACYVFELFAQAWGLGLKFARNTNQAVTCDILYTAQPGQIEAAGPVVIPFEEGLYGMGARCEVVRKDGLELYLGGGRTGSDLVAATYRLITLLDEALVPPEDRDRRGIFLVDKLPPNLREASRIPLVENHARHLLERLLRARPHLASQRLPRWPDGKKYALCLTHDTDAATLGAPRELLTNLAKFLLRREGVHGRMFLEGLRSRRGANPYFSFPGWGRYESAHGLRSCFYLFVKPLRCKFDLNDCKSDVFTSKVPLDDLKRLARSGWEFGLHPAINAKTDIDEFIHAKRLIEDRLETHVYGLRHHYWALDWAKPYLTFRKHVNAGFRYDSSIAWRDQPGFRAGTCLPYRPFDPARDKTLDMYELPACLMDGHLISGSQTKPNIVTEGIAVLSQVKSQGGVAVLDWHTEAFCNAYLYQGHLGVLQQILADFLQDADVWLASPWEVVKWWHQRSLMLRGDN